MNPNSLVHWCKGRANAFSAEKGESVKLVFGENIYNQCKALRSKERKQQETATKRNNRYPALNAGHNLRDSRIAARAKACSDNRYYDVLGATRAL